MNRLNLIKMKKHLIKYTLEFVVIVLGISVSFWVNKRQNDKENKINEIHIYEDIKMELNELTKMINERTAVFNFDIALIDNVYNESYNSKFTYQDMLTAVADWRGFEPSIEIYSSLKYDGGLKYVSNSEIKLAIDKFYARSSSIYANMEDEVIVQREILKFLHINYPLVLLNQDSKLIDENTKINHFKNIITNDLTFRSLLKSKRRFMYNKKIGIDQYRLRHEELLSMIDKVLSY